MLKNKGTFIGTEFCDLKVISSGYTNLMLYENLNIIFFIDNKLIISKVAEYKNQDNAFINNLFMKIRSILL